LRLRDFADEAIRWWKRAYRQGSWAAAFNLGMFFRDAKQWANALKWFERAIQAGDKDGLVEITKIIFAMRVTGLLVSAI
jgi:TPR repeat protein